MRLKLIKDDSKIDLMKETLQKSGRLRFKAHGLSMIPFILSGDILTVEKTDLNEDISVGDIILFQSQKRLFVHRLIKKSGNIETQFITKGDNMPFPDNPINQSQLLGRVIKIERWGQIIYPESSLSKPSNYIIAKLLSYWALLILILLKFRDLIKT